MTMGAIAGLVLFLYGVTRMAEGLEAIALDRAKDCIITEVLFAAQLAKARERGLLR